MARPIAVIHISFVSILKALSYESKLHFVCSSFLMPGFHLQQTPRPRHKKTKQLWLSSHPSTNRFVLTQNLSLSWSKLVLWKPGLSANDMRNIIVLSENPLKIRKIAFYCFLISLLLLFLLFYYLIFLLLFYFYYV